MRIKGTRLAGSSTSKVEAFFLENPEEELSLADIMNKLGVNRKALEFALKRLKDEGLIESVHVVRLRSKGIASAIGGNQP